MQQSDRACVSVPGFKSAGGKLLSAFDSLAPSPFPRQERCASGRSRPLLSNPLHACRWVVTSPKKYNYFFLEHTDSDMRQVSLFRVRGLSLQQAHVAGQTD